MTRKLPGLSCRIERAQELEDAGEYMQAMELWRAAYKICPQLEEPTWKSNGACTLSWLAKRWQTERHARHNSPSLLVMNCADGWRSQMVGNRGRRCDKSLAH